MRLRNIIEGIRMGSSDLSRPANKDYTIGFEFEITVDMDEFKDLKQQEFDDYDDFESDDFNEFYGNYDSTDFVNEWVLNNIIYAHELEDFITSNDITPRYGMITDSEEILEYHQEAFDSQLENMYSQDQLDEIQDLLLDIKETPNYEFDDEAKYLITKYVLLHDNQPADDDAIQEKLDIFNTAKNPTLVFETWSERLSNHFLFDETEYDTNAAVYTDEQKTKMIGLDQIEDVDHMFELFNLNNDTLYEILTEDEDFNSALHAQIEDEWASSDNSSDVSTDEIRIVKQLIGQELNITTINRSSTRDWAVVPDGTAGVDAEIISPVMPVSTAIDSMHKILNFIEKTKGFDTTKATGLHINIGTWTTDEYNKIDWLKFLMILEPQRVLDQFLRSNNDFAQDKLPTIINSLHDVNIRSDYNTALTAINQRVINRSPKYSAVNLSKLQQLGYIELRAPGNLDYTKRGDEIETLIRKTIRALELASDPNALRQQYLKRLYKYMPATTKPKGKVINFWATHFNKRLNVRRPLASMTQAFNIMIQNNEQKFLKDIDDQITQTAIDELNRAVNSSTTYKQNPQTFTDDKQQLLNVLQSLPQSSKTIRMIKDYIIYKNS